MEIWKYIPGYEGLYEISNFGRVKSLPKRNRPGKTIILKPTMDTQGYLYVSLYNLNKQKTVRIHPLVANNFVDGKTKLKSQVNHVDGTKENNNSSNLEWVTGSENMLHAVAMGLLSTKKGEENPASKLTKINVKEIRKLYSTGLYTQRFISNKFNISFSTIHLVVRNKIWKSV